MVLTNVTMPKLGKPSKPAVLLLRFASDSVILIEMERSYEVIQVSLPAKKSLFPAVHFRVLCLLLLQYFK